MTSAVTTVTTRSLCLLLFLLPSVLMAASRSTVWPMHNRAVHADHSRMANLQQQQHRHAVHPSAPASIQPAAVWSGVPVSVATFPVSGNSSSPLYAVAYPAPLHLLAVDPVTAAVLNGSYSLPDGYQTQNLVATASVVVLHLQPADNSDAADSIHVLDARSLRLLTSYDLDYSLQVLGINAAGDTMLTAVFGSNELLTLHVMTGKRIAVYDGGQSDLIVLGGALHPTSGAVHVWNGSVDTGSFNLLSIAVNNSVVSSFPLQLDSLHLFGSISLDLSAQYVSVLYIADKFQCIVQQYQLSTGQRTFTIPLNAYLVRLTQFLSPAWTAGAALTVNAFADQILMLGKDGALPPLMVGGTPTLLATTDVAVLPSAGRRGNYTVLVSTSLPRAVYELDQQGRLVYQYLTDDANPCSYPQHVAADAAGRVYVPYCNGSVGVFDGRSHELLHNFSIGTDNILANLIAGPNDTVYYICTASRGIVQQHIVTGAVIATLTVGDDSQLEGLAYDPRNHSVWSTDLGFGSSSSIYQLSADGRLLTNLSCPPAAAAAAVPATAAASSMCWEVALDPAHGRLLVSYYDASAHGFLLWLDAGNGSVLDSYKFPGDGAGALAVSRDGSRLYAPDGDAVYVFDQPRA